MNTKYIKTALLSLTLVAGIAVFTPVFASIDQNLSYGSRGQEVTELQEYLIANNYLTTTATGNFYSLTLKAVKAYQEVNNLPSTGYVGKLTRASINADLETNLASSTDEAVQETGTSTPAQNSDAMKAAQAQSAIMSAQLQAQLDTQAKLDAINKSLQGIGSPVAASASTTPLPDFYYGVTTQGNNVYITSTEGIDPNSISITSNGQPLYLSSVNKVESTGNSCASILSHQDNGATAIKACTQNPIYGYTSYTYLITLSSPASDISVYFKTIDGRGSSQAK